MEEITNLIQTNIQCSNYNCLVYNPVDNQFCHQCGTPIVRRYLYVLGEEIKSCQLGDIIDNRYIVQQPSILLDTKPGLSPNLTDDLPSHIVPYLKLFSQQGHIPQVYGFTTLHEQEIWLLEYFSTSTSKPLPKMPRLLEVWHQGTAFQQIQWLWQIASIWQPLYEENVAASLLELSLIRVQGSIIKIRELQLVEKRKTPLKSLGHVWSTLVKTADKNIQELLETIVQAIISHQIIESQQILEILDQAILEFAKNQEYKYQICSYTDVGKTRQNNEDSCYPSSGNYLEIEANQASFAIVCDGVGGHEGGEVASNMTVEFLQAELGKFTVLDEQLTPATISAKLEQLTRNANDVVSDRNNIEQRIQQRDRMGTTLVMGFIHQHEIYFTHVGDSRIYGITKHNCQQLTVDDDLACRQVRLGYTLYRDALLWPGAGALIQALGMHPSITLEPTTQRYLVGENSVFLLCSDGLSDFDRVEQYGEQEILPILTQEKNIQEVGQRLIDIANEKNGHDNITIALIYCQIIPKLELTEINLEKLVSTIKDLPIQKQEISVILDQESRPQTELNSVKTDAKTKQFSPPKQKKSAVKLDFILTIFIILGSIYLIYAWLVEPLFKKVYSPGINFQKGQIIKTTDNIALYPQPLLEENNLAGVADIPQGSFLQITDINSDNSWVNLKVCRLGTTETGNSLPTGELGWSESQEISQKINLDYIADEVETNWCDEQISFKVGDVIKTTANILINGEQTTDIPPETILKIKEINEAESLVKMEICTPILAENNTQISAKETNFISTKELINKFTQIDIKSLENTSCQSNSKPNIDNNN